MMIIYTFGPSARSLAPFHSNFGPAHAPPDRARAYVDPQLRRTLRRLGREIVQHFDAALEHEQRGEHELARRERIELSRVQKLHAEATRKVEGT